MFCKTKIKVVYLNDLSVCEMQLVLFPSMCSPCSVWDKAENTCAIHSTTQNMWDLCSLASNTYQTLVLFREVFYKRAFKIHLDWICCFLSVTFGHGISVKAVVVWMNELISRYKVFWVCFGFKGKTRNK